MFEVLMAVALQAAEAAPAASGPAPIAATMVVAPVGPLWVRTPSRRDLERFGQGLPLYLRQEPQRAIIECRIAADGSLEPCAVIADRSGNGMFGKSALRLMSRFQFVTAMPDGRPTVGGTLRVPVSWGWLD